MELHHTTSADEYAASCRASWPPIGAGATPPGPFWWVTDNGEVAGAAHWTPPYSVLVTSMPATAWAPLAESVLRQAERAGIALRGVTGPRPSKEVPGASGHRETASESHAGMLGPWLTAFGEEVDEPIGGDGTGQARRMFAAGSLDIYAQPGYHVTAEHVEVVLRADAG